MSVLVTMRVKGDTEKFRRFTSENGDKLREIADDARSRGCLHHRFGVGEDFVLVVDEWESPDQFRQFFEGNPRIEEVMRAAGAQSEPEFSFTEAVETADQF